MDDSYYTEAELASIREHKLEGDRIAAEIGRARGYTLHPRLAALREKRPAPGLERA